MLEDAHVAGALKDAYADLQLPDEGTVRSAVKRLVSVW